MERHSVSDAIYVYCKVTAIATIDDETLYKFRGQRTTLLSWALLLTRKLHRKIEIILQRNVCQTQWGNISLTQA